MPITVVVTSIVLAYLSVGGTGQLGPRASEPGAQTTPGPTGSPHPLGSSPGPLSSPSPDPLASSGAPSATVSRPSAGGGSGGRAGGGSGVAPATTTPWLVAPVTIMGDDGVVNEYTFRLPSGIEAGDFIIITVQVTQEDSFTIPAGWTNIATAVGDQYFMPRVVMFFRWAVAGDTAVTFPFPRGINNGYITKTSSLAVYRGVNRAAPVAGTSTAFIEFGGENSITVPRINAVADSRLVMCAGAAGDDHPTAWTGTPAGMTNKAESSNAQWRGLVFYDQAVGAGPTGTRTATRGNGTFQAAVLVDLAPAPAG
jgi:hypothetical protein